MKIAIFSGSFDPPHIGHLAVAGYICKYEGLDEVWFTPTPHNPLKEKRALSPVHLRLNMVEIAIAGYPQFHVCDIECSLPQPSYTINTLTVLQKRYPQHKFTLIMGADNWENLSRWKDYQQIIDKFGIMIYPRKGYTVCEPDGFPQVKLIGAPEVHVSSTAIREAAKRGENVGTFVPKNIDTYIKNHKLYHENSSSTPLG